MSGFKMDDYVDVAERIHSFYERFPEGSLQSATPPHVMEIAGKPFIVYHALAFRSPDDPVPAHGWAWEPVPGPSNFTKDSELMNAETAAWGRAIVALGFATKKIASQQEVRNRQVSAPAEKVASQSVPSPAVADAGGAAAPPAPFTPPASASAEAGDFTFPSGKHKDKKLSEVPADYLTWYVENGPRQDVKTMIDLYRMTGEQGTVDDTDGIPF